MSTPPAVKRGAVLNSPRNSLIGQLGHLAEEASALRTIIQRVPEAILVAHPLQGEPSVKELFALLLRADELIHISFARDAVMNGRATGRRASSSELLEGEMWDDLPIEQILDRVAAARLKLVDVCSAATDDAWEAVLRMDDQDVDLFNFLYGVVQNDVDVLRRIAERLHDSRFTSPQS